MKVTYKPCPVCGKSAVDACIGVTNGDRGWAALFHCPHCGALYSTITADNGLLLEVVVPETVAV